ncbi:HAMP domain-containing protein [Lachnospiraceae bacterium WCA-693-APC-MOT-I]|uniref:histidine kinase n=2 Tax=Velocimicrobium porci TaxID=2606634 RepID=A0A6L5Y2W8_9FIRM|nr:HAMP domain-containing protein [Velocimicrobium porci]
MGRWILFSKLEAEVFPIFQLVKNRLHSFKSMRIQAGIVLVLVGIIPLIIFSQVILTTYQNEAIEVRIGELKEKGSMISNLLISSNYFANREDSDFSEANKEIAQVADAYRGRIVIVDRNLQILKDTYGLEEGKTIISEQVINCYNGSSSQYIDHENEYVELVMPIINATTKENSGIMIMSFSTKGIYQVYDSMQHKTLILIIVISILVVLASIVYANILTKPFSRVSSIIDHATEGYLDEKVSIKGYTEVEKISDSFNHLLTRLQTLENSRQEFVSNVSHELKTPITSIKVLAESLLAQEDAPAELYREFMEDITEEIERENKIINDLLSLVKLDKKSGELNISSVNINELLEQILKRLRPIAAKRNIELVFESFRPVEAEVDEVKLSLAINNLIENAIKYNYDDGWVRVSLNADHKFFYVKVADSGVGIPEELQESIFERFYRVDKARSRETGGTGLGLSITRSAVLMHRGAIKVYSKEKEGATFTIRIPLNYIA